MWRWILPCDVITSLFLLASTAHGLAFVKRTVVNTERRPPFFAIPSHYPILLRGSHFLCARRNGFYATKTAAHQEVDPSFSWPTVANRVEYWYNYTNQHPLDSHGWFQWSQALSTAAASFSTSKRIRALKIQKLQDDMVQAMERAVALERAAVLKHMQAQHQNVRQDSIHGKPLDSRWFVEKETCRNLLAALCGLGQCYLRVRREEDALKTVDEWHYWVSLQMPFSMEDDDHDAFEGVDKMNFSKQVPSFAWIDRIPERTTDNNTKNDEKEETTIHVALQTMGEIPLLDPSTLNLLQTCANRYRDRMQNQTMHSSRRFTMQYKGNTDLHLADIVNLDSNFPKTNSSERAAVQLLHARINQVLLEKVYPLIRASFAQEGPGISGGGNLIDKEGVLCLYDALLVRYNATEAIDGSEEHLQVTEEHLRRPMGASLPFHYDGGLISINIALNSRRADHVNSQHHEEEPQDNEHQFQGGGTLFQSLLHPAHSLSRNSSTNSILHPIKPGHAILHRSTQRHAGAPTTAGVRDILVLFVTLRPKAWQQEVPCSSDSNEDEVKHSAGRVKKAIQLAPAPPVERAFYIKSMARQEQQQQKQQLSGLSSSSLSQAPSPKVIQTWKEMQRRSYDLVTRIHPWDGAAWFELGCLSLSSSVSVSASSKEEWERSQRGVTCLERAAALCPGDARIFAHLGMVAYAKRWMLYDEMKREEQESASIQISQIEATNGEETSKEHLDVTLHLEKEQRMAMTALHQAIDLYSLYRTLLGVSREGMMELAAARLSRSELHLSMGSVDKACRDAQEVVVDAPPEGVPGNEVWDEVVYAARELIVQCELGEEKRDE